MFSDFFGKVKKQVDKITGKHKKKTRAGPFSMHLAKQREISKDEEASPRNDSAYEEDKNEINYESNNNQEIEESENDNVFKNK